MEEKDELTTIGVSRATKSLLDAKKVHPRETYEDVIIRLATEPCKEATTQ